jgi:threonine dehydrogenase-like Zn-dependent dehydrogenase
MVPARRVSHLCVRRLAEPLAVGLHAVLRSGVGPDDDVLILGGRLIGIAALLGSITAGAAAVFVSEVFVRTGRVGPGRRH